MSAILVVVSACMFVVVAVTGEMSLSQSAIIGIIVGIIIMLLLLLLLVIVMVIVRRGRRKSHQSQSSSSAAARCTSSRSTTSVSTISAGNGCVLSSSFSGMSLAPHHQPSRAMISDNAGTFIVM